MSRVAAPRPRREDRRHTPIDRPDQRTPGQRDRDRILYASAFRRLAGVTQVVGTYEGHVFHNRLTHTLEVAQIARRLAETFRAESPRLCRDLGGVDPDVVEAAALAHDLGHPPFGHIAETELDRLVRADDADGFEGNAQSFRTLVRLSAHREGYPGLNLSRATLDAVLKYPWLRADSGRKHVKFGAYRCDEEDFVFARGDRHDRGERQSLEAAIMDHADAVAYSVHDFEDFYRAGLVPVERLRYNAHEFRAVLDGWADEEPERRAAIVAAGPSLVRLLDLLLAIDSGYRGTFSQRAAIRTASAQLISEFIFAAELADRAETAPLRVRPESQLRMDFLQRLVRIYVIANPRLATQQTGQRAVVRTLFGIYRDAVRSGDPDLIPPRFLHLLSTEAPPIDEGATRIAADIVAGFTDQQAVTMYRRLTGIDPGSVMDVLHG